MPGYRLSAEADLDIEAITEYTIGAFGPMQAIKYVAALEQSFETLANFPRIGLPTYDLRQGLYRFPHQSHVIFYTYASDHILIVRILHGRADVKRLF